MKSGKTWRWALTILLALMMAVGLMPATALADGEFEKDADNTSLGTSGIAVQDKWDKTSGSYVWYGKYTPDAMAHRHPTKHRVLAKDASASVMLFDCDGIPFEQVFDNGSQNGGQKTNVWAKSSLHAILNNPNVGGLLVGSFGDVERGAIMTTSISECGETSDDKVFLLSVAEAKSLYKDDEARQKTGATYNWWLRSAGTPTDDTHAAVVTSSGSVSEDGLTVDATTGGFSSAFNIDMSCVAFSSKISDETNAYKLTLWDKGLSIESGVATVSGATVTVPYAIGGDHAGDGTQASYVITSKSWNGETGQWVDGAELLAYGRLGDAGSGSFTLPQGYTADGWGTDYFVYALAENVSGAHETDCASAPAPIEVEKPVTYSVKLTGGANAAASGGATNQAVGEGAEMAAVTYTAKVGYHFEAFGDISACGVTARLEGGRVVVSGAPTADVEMRVPDAVKDEQAAPVRVAKPSTSGHPATGRLDVSWKAAEGAKTYEVQWRKKGGKWKRKTAKSLKYTVSGLKKGALYEVRVRAKAGAATGAWSTTSRRWLRGSSGVRAKVGSKPGTIKVSWRKNKRANAGYKVFVYTKKGGKMVKVKTAEAEAGRASVTVGGLKAGKRYYVRVRPLRKASGRTYTGTLCGYRAVRAAR